MKAVIQCGGKGTRLRPYTMILPKPLMPVGSRPVLELLLLWLRRNNIQETYITTGYLSHLISSFCGDGSLWDMKIHYTQESEPLGTIGPLSLLRDQLDSDFLVINGDVLTDLSLKSFHDCHRQHGGLVTVATAQRQIKSDFGVIEQADGEITEFREKPIMTHLVSMGIYCMSPDILGYIPDRIPFGFDDLILCLLDKQIPTYTFKHDGMWLDVGRVEDFQNAQKLAWDDQAPAFEVVSAMRSQTTARSSARQANGSAAAN
ncbi:MAG: sugar phosphate nucleotidyltransferase [Hyphomicrobium sp.]